MAAKYPQDNIIFLREVSNDRVMQMNSASDIFVLLSKIEGFSTALLEAGLLKNALITTNVGGARELLPNDSYGFIIENNEKSFNGYSQRPYYSSRKTQKYAGKNIHTCYEKFHLGNNN